MLTLVDLGPNLPFLASFRRHRKPYHNLHKCMHFDAESVL